MIVAALTDGDKRGAVAEKGNMQKYINCTFQVVFP
jgi:hypothetical protein